MLIDIFTLTVTLMAGMLVGGLAVLIALNRAAIAHQSPRRPYYTDQQVSDIIDAIHGEGVA